MPVAVGLNRKPCISNQDGLTHFTKKTEPGGTLERFEFLVLKFRIVLYINMPNMHVWARQIWSSGVSLKRSCKMQLRGAEFESRVMKPHFLAGFLIVIIM